jgi:hypothetical protein
LKDVFVTILYLRGDKVVTENHLIWKADMRGFAIGPFNHLRNTAAHFATYAVCMKQYSGVKGNKLESSTDLQVFRPSGIQKKTRCSGKH